MGTQFVLRDPFGTMLTQFTNLVKAEYARGENKTGYMYLDFDPSSIDASLFRLDCRIEPWRQVGGLAPYLDGETVFFVRKWGWSIDSSGRELFRIYAQDANYLLDGRHVAYEAGNAMADQTNEADDLMKAIVRENLGSTAVDTTRSLATYLTVAADLASCASITKAFSRRQVVNVLQDIAEESFKDGNYLVYDIVYTSPTMLEFRTYKTQRGNNHGKASGQTVVISKERQNFAEPEFTEDHTDEFPYIYAGGQGAGALRTIVTATSTAAIGASPFNRRELWIDARNTAVTAAVQSEADAGLQANRARKTLTGRVIDTDGCMDGVHYRYGDIVYAEYRGAGYDAHINMLHVTIEGGRETRVNQIRAEA